MAKSTSGAHCLRRKTSVFLASKCYVGVNVGNVKKTVYKIVFSFGLCGQRFRSRSFLKFCSGHLLLRWDSSGFRESSILVRMIDEFRFCSLISPGWKSRCSWNTSHNFPLWEIILFKANPKEEEKKDLNLNKLGLGGKKGGGEEVGEGWKGGGERKGKGRKKGRGSKERGKWEERGRGKKGDGEVREDGINEGKLGDKGTGK